MGNILETCASLCAVACFLLTGDVGSRAFSTSSLWSPYLIVTSASGPQDRMFLFVSSQQVLSTIMGYLWISLRGGKENKK